MCGLYNTRQGADLRKVRDVSLKIMFYRWWCGGIIRIAMYRTCYMEESAVQLSLRRQWATIFACLQDVLTSGSWSTYDESRQEVGNRP